MIKTEVTLKTVNEIIDFVEMMNRIPYNATIGNDRSLRLNPKSMMDMFTLDYSLPMELYIDTDDMSVLGMLGEFRNSDSRYSMPLRPVRAGA